VSARIVRPRKGENQRWAEKGGWQLQRGEKELSKRRELREKTGRGNVTLWKHQYDRGKERTGKGGGETETVKLQLWSRG